MIDLDNIVFCEINGITEEEAWERENAIAKDAQQYREEIAREQQQETTISDFSS